MAQVQKDFRRLFTALVTPFKSPRLDVDFDSLARLVQAQLKSGVRGFVVNGTTAESPTLEIHEVDQIFKQVKSAVSSLSSDCLIVMGTGTNCTSTSIELTKRAGQLGADAALVVVPYYNKPPQRGLIKHFEMIANQSEIPIILYNVPGRTITRLEPETVAHLSQHPKIIGIKEAS